MTISDTSHVTHRESNCRFLDHMHCDISLTSLSILALVSDLYVSGVTEFGKKSNTTQSGERNEGYKNWQPFLSLLLYFCNLHI